MTGLQLPSRKVLASGTAGLAAWAFITFACPWLGIPVNLNAVIMLAGHNFTMPEIIGAILALCHGIAYMVPQSLKDHAKALDMDVKQLAQWLPQIQDSYPGDDKKTVAALSNIKPQLNNGR